MKKIQCFISMILLGFMTLPALADKPYITLSEEKLAELLADYPNPAWGPKNWYLNQLIKIEDGLYTYANKNNTRTFFLVTDEGVLVADPISVEDAKLIREAIASVTDKPVKYVLYSHNHWDHVTGAQIFKDEGAQIIAHEKCRERIMQRPHPDVVVPDITFPGNHVMEFGGERIEMVYYGRNHSSCLVFPFLRNKKYMFLVDVVSPGAIPWGIVPDTDFIGSVETLKQLEKYDFEAIIPGHGAPLAPKSSLTERRLYLTALMDAVRNDLDEHDGFKPGFHERVEKATEDWAYMRAYSFQFRQNLETMLYYIGIGE